MVRRVFLILCVASLAACQPRGISVNPLAGIPKEELQSAAQHAETPAGINSVQFKELGETKRYGIMARIIQDTWGERCKPNAIAPQGYSPNGSSQWRVHCEYSTLAYDYLVTLPERSESKARALQCYAAGRLTTCTIVGRPDHTSSGRPA